MTWFREGVSLALVPAWTVVLVAWMSQRFSLPILVVVNLWGTLCYNLVFHLKYLNL